MSVSTLTPTADDFDRDFDDIVAHLHFDEPADGPGTQLPPRRKRPSRQVEKREAIAESFGINRGHTTKRAV